MEFFGQPFVVGVEEGDPPTFCLADASVACWAWAGVGLVDVADSAGGVLGDDVGGIVRRAVVDDDDLVGVARLGQDAVEGAANVPGGIVGRHNHRDGDGVGIVRHGDHLLGRWRRSGPPRD